MHMLTAQANLNDCETLPGSLAEGVPDLQSVYGSRYLQWKAPLDRALAFLLLIPGLPLIGILVLLVRATSRGPGIFRQRRVGRGGRVFQMLKLRSMRMDAESQTGAVWTVPGGHDPRLTKVGYCLRKFHLDELPQLINVLRGEMSLVGPRPERPEFVPILAEKLPDYLDRLAVTPGITGLAQINLPPDVDLRDVQRKIVLDKQYIQQANLVFDLRMLCCTLMRIVGVKGTMATKIWRLERHAPHPPVDPEKAGSYSPTPDAIARQCLEYPRECGRLRPNGAGEKVNGHSKTPAELSSLTDSSALGPQATTQCSSDGLPGL